MRENKLMQSYITFPSLAWKEWEETSTQFKPSVRFSQLRLVTNLYLALRPSCYHLPRTAYQHCTWKS